METITKKINYLGTDYPLIFDVVNSDHGDSGMQWYYGTLQTPEKEFEFSICVMHDKNSGTSTNEITWVDDTPHDNIAIENLIEKEFDWSEINDEHEQNEIELEKVMSKSRNENWD